MQFEHKEQDIMQLNRHFMYCVHVLCSNVRDQMKEFIIYCTCIAREPLRELTAFSMSNKVFSTIYSTMYVPKGQNTCSRINDTQ